MRKWIKKNKPYWGVGENKVRLTKPNKQINLFTVGMVILLWIPIILPQKQENQNTKFGTTQRPVDIPYNSFFLNRNLFNIIKYFPFDFHLNITHEEFNSRFRGLIEEHKTGLERVKLIGIKKGALKYDSEGRIDEGNTFFLFHDNVLAALNLRLVINPKKENDLFENFDKEFSIGTGKTLNQGTNYYWLTKESVYSETLNWHHGLSSGTNSFRLFRNDYLLNDLPIELSNFYSDVDNMTTDFPEFTKALEICKTIIANPDYENYVFNKFDVAPVVIGVAEAKYDKFIDEIKVLERIWGKRKEN